MAARLRIRSGPTTVTTEILIVDDDGTERHLVGVRQIEWCATAGPSLCTVRIVAEVETVDLLVEAFAIEAVTAEPST